MSKEDKYKQCPECNQGFVQFRSFQKTCTDPGCMMSYAKKKRDKKQKKENNIEKIEYYRTKLSWQHKQTQKVFNKLRRLQAIKWYKELDMEPECISCGKKNMDWCCGHLKTVGSQGGLRYDPINTELQCNMYCNQSLSGNINGNKNTRGYRQGVLDKYGIDEGQSRLNYCDINTAPVKWTCEQLEEMRKEFNAEIRGLETE